MITLKIQEGTKTIAPFQYEGNLDIEELIIADTVEEIGEAAFYGCSNLKKITWGKRVHTIGRDAFYKCVSLELLHPPRSVKLVEVCAFALCSGLTYVEFEDNDGIEIENNVFTNCTGLTCAILPEGLKTIYEETFSGCTKLEDVFIPSTVTGIGIMAFCGIGAKEIELPDSIEVIGMFAFYKSKLTSVVMPNSVLTIEGAAFGHCNYLERVEVGDSVVCIGRNAFENCSVLSEVTFKSTIIGSIGTSVFKGCKNLKRINVPVSAMDTYKRLLPKYLHRKLVEF